MTEARQEPQNRAHLLEAIATSWNAYTRLIDTLADEQWTAVTDDQGWTVKDHVAHVTAWENVITEVFRNGSPQYETLQLTESEWRERGLAGAEEVIHARKAGQSLRRVMHNRDVTHARLVTILSGLSEEAMHRPFAEFGAVDATGTVLVELMDALARRYDHHSAAILAITGVDEPAPAPFLQQGA